MLAPKHCAQSDDGICIAVWSVVDEEVRLALFRVFQQSMGNIVEHSGASELSVRFSFDAEEARLEISDNGTGFKVPANRIDFVREGRYGLAGAAERVNVP